MMEELVVALAELRSVSSSIERTRLSIRKIDQDRMNSIHDRLEEVRLVAKDDALLQLTMMMMMMMSKLKSQSVVVMMM